MKKFLPMLIGIVLLSAGAFARAQDLREQCRVAAGFDLKGNWSGGKKEVTEQSIATCRATIVAYPEEPQLWAYLGRALYLNGHPEESWQWIEKAAQRTVVGQALAGVAFDSGYGVRKDEAEAARWFRKAADQGNASAQTNLGAMYADGSGVEKDEAEAVRWYRKAAEQGSALAQKTLGEAYEKGSLVEKNGAEAVRWFRMAAEQGNATEQYNLASRYESGSGVEKNEVEAGRWYRKAAEQGHPRAHFKLGKMYELGSGVEKDEASAVREFAIALKNGDANVRNDAVEALGSVKSPEVVELLAVALRDKDRSVKSKAAWKLALLSIDGIDVSKAVGPLVAVFKDSHSMFDRSNAVEALATINSPEALATLVAALNDSEEEVSHAATRGLGQMPMMSADRMAALASALKDENQRVQWGAAIALAKFESPDAVAPLIVALRGGDLWTRRQAAQALGYTRSPEAVPALIAELTDGDESVRWGAALSLAYIESPIAVPALVAALNDSDERVRETAAQALHDTKAPILVPALVAVQNVSDEQVSAEAADVPSDTKSAEAVARLSAELKDSDSQVRKAAASALGDIESPEVVAPLIAALKDRDSGVRSTAAFMLHRSKSPKAVAPLIVALDDIDVDVRIFAARALGEIKSPEAIPRLVVALKDEQQGVRRAAAWALAEMGQAEAIPDVISLLVEACLDSWKLSTWDGYVFYDSYDCAVTVRIAPQALPDLVMERTGDIFVRETVGLGMNPVGVLPVLEKVSRRSVPIRARVAFLRPFGREQSGPALTWLDAEVARLEGSAATDLASNAYLQALMSHWYFEAGAPDKALRIAAAAQGQARPWERALQIVLAWQKAEALYKLGQPAEALSLLNEARKDVLPGVTGVERKESRLLFDSYTAVLRGRALLALKRSNEAVAALLEAEQLLHRDLQLSDLREDREEARRMRHLIYNFRSEAQWEGAKVDAQKGLALGDKVKLSSTIARAAEQSGLLTAIRLAVGDGDGAQAQQLTEKLVLLRQSWGEGPAPLQSAAPDRQAALAKVDELVRTRDQVSAKLAEVDPKAGQPRASSTQERQKLERELNDARQALKEFSVKLKRDKPEVAALVRSEPADLAQVQALLGADQALVQYLLLEEKGYAFVVKQDTIRIRDLPLGERELGPLVRSYQRLLTCAVKEARSAGRNNVVVAVNCSTAAEELPKVAHQLALWLLVPLADDLKDTRRLTLVPHGPLHMLPFATLPVAGQPLIERYVLSQVASASAFTLAARPQGASGKLLAMAVSKRDGWSPLTQVDDEVDDIGKAIVSAEIKKDQAASTVLVKGRDLRNRPLHFAMHGTAGWDESDTRLVMSDADLTLREVWGLYLDGSPRVVLSACESALGEQLSGDEIVSLANGFLFAGARAVVASLWKVPDAQTRELMGLFYGHVAAGADTATALTLAQREMMGRGRPPYAWAGFTVTGG